MTRPSAHRLTAARGPDRGGALIGLWGALYGAKYCDGCANFTVAKAPARGAVGRSRGGAQVRLDSARGVSGGCSEHEAHIARGARRSEGPTPHAPRSIFAKKKQGRTP